jgi:hypothetical protein
MRNVQGQRRKHHDMEEVHVGEAVSLPPPKKREKYPSSEKKTSVAVICTRSFAQILEPFQKYAFCGQALFNVSRL